jgi:pilus assembly protein CpaB
MKKNVWKRRVISFITVVLLISTIVLYTNFKIKAEVNETQVIVTKVDIPPRTEITKDMLTTITVPMQGIPTNAFKAEKDIVGKWTVAGYGISSNSFIYEEKVVNKSELPDAGILALNEDEVAFPLLVDLETSLGNSIIPNSSVDLYFRSLIDDEEDSKTKAMYGKLASQVRVVAVKDSDASNVFDPEGYNQGKKQQNTNSQQNSLAKIYIFAIPKELNDLINQAKLLGDIVPIATSESYKEDKDTTSEQNEIIKYVEGNIYKTETEKE